MIKHLLYFLLYALFVLPLLVGANILLTEWKPANLIIIGACIFQR